MTYRELKQRFCKLKCESPHEDLTAHIVFTADSFLEEYGHRMCRTYVITSDNKAFRPNMGGYSIFGCSLDGSDIGVRLDQYMAEERGGKNGWKVETCYILEELRDAAAIPSYQREEQDDGIVRFYFGNTCIKATEAELDGETRLVPIGGDQTVGGQWVELEPDVVMGYCSLLARQFNKG